MRLRVLERVKTDTGWRSQRSSANQRLEIGERGRVLDRSPGCPASRRRTCPDGLFRANLIRPPTGKRAWLMPVAAPSPYGVDSVALSLLTRRLLPGKTSSRLRLRRG